MKYYGKVVFNGVPAAGLAVNLLDVYTGESRWSGFTALNGFFFADVAGESSLIAAVSGEFTGGLYPAMAQSLQSISKERIVLLGSPCMANNYLSNPHYNSLYFGSYVSEVISSNGSSIPRDFFSAVRTKFFPTNTDRVKPYSYSRGGTLGYAVSSQAVALDPLTGTNEVATDSTWVTHLLGDMHWKDIPYTVTYFPQQPGEFRINTPANFLHEPYTFSDHLYVQQSEEERAGKRFRIENSTRDFYTGVDLQEPSGVLPWGWAGLRGLCAIDGSLFPTLAIAVNHEVFTHTPTSGWVKLMDLPYPVGNNTEPDPFPINTDFYQTGAVYGGKRYFRDAPYNGPNTLFSFTEYAYEAGAPAGLVTADQYCRQFSQHCMYGTRAVRFATYVPPVDDFINPPVFPGFSDFDFASGTLTMHPADYSLMTGTGGFDGFPSGNWQTYVIGDKAYIFKNNGKLAEYDLLTNTAVIIDDPNSYATSSPDPIHRIPNAYQAQSMVTASTGVVYMEGTVSTTQGGIGTVEYDRPAVLSIKAGGVLSCEAYGGILVGDRRFVFATHF